jgi:hypothetical protein
VYPVKYEHHLHIKGIAIPVTAVEARMYISCEVRTSSTYTKVKLYQ